jgi:hypothetical protein
MCKNIFLVLGLALYLLPVPAMHAGISYTNLSCPTNSSYEGSVTVTWDFPNFDSTHGENFGIWVVNQDPDQTYHWAYVSVGVNSDSVNADWITYGAIYNFAFYYNIADGYPTVPYFNWYEPENKNGGPALVYYYVEFQC